MNGHENKEYIDARNRLIPAAERYANEQFASQTNRQGWGRLFILKMDRLSVGAGIQAGYLHRQSKSVIFGEERA